jgi:hypothetical protein
MGSERRIDTMTPEEAFAELAHLRAENARLRDEVAAADEASMAMAADAIIAAQAMNPLRIENARLREAIQTALCCGGLSERVAGALRDALEGKGT